MRQLIVEISETASFKEMGSELKSAIKTIGISWPQSKMIGTKTVDGRKLILITSNISGELLEMYMNVSYPSGRFEDEAEINDIFNLGWNVLAEEDVKIDQSLILPFVIDDYEYDESGEIIGSIPVTDLTGRLQTFAGKNWSY